MKNKQYILFALFFSLLISQVAWGSTPLHPDKAYKFGVEALNNQDYEEALKYLLIAVDGNPSAANLRMVADIYVLLQRFDEAIPYYYKAADIYEKIGDVDGATVLRRKAEAITSTVDLFVETEFKGDTSIKLAKYEPQTGAYIGAFVEYEEAVGHRNVKKFNELTGKQHAVYYTYHAYDKPFPHNWARNVKESGAAVHLALETIQGLDIVKDDETLRSFAKLAKEAEVPIFLRFNSEMNGDWVPWHGNPKKYIEKFRLVSKVMKEDAPNVVMVWAPNSVPEKNILEYYPGDDYVDWVGVNLYSVKFFNGDPNQPADQVNPLDLLDFVYKNFAARKPIQISEYAATHYSTAGDTDATEFAITKMHMLYYGIKTKYPRIKMINWYSANNLKYAHSAERKLNNYSILENEGLKKAYSQMIQDPYFLSSVVNGPYAVKEDIQNKKAVKPLVDGAYLTGIVKGSGWIKTHDPYISKVEYRLDGSLLTTAKQFPFIFSFDADKLSRGKHGLEVTVYDSKGKVASRKKISFLTGERKSNGIYLQVGSKEAFMNNQNHPLTEAPFIDNGSTYVPLRFIGEAIGGTVKWEASTGYITIVQEGVNLVLMPSKGKAVVNGKEVTLTLKPILKNNTTFVPLRFILENFGLTVNWEASIQEVEIIK
ncbi:stalk domain-containing protein [Alkaliphilus hydrothermalis]|uniref:Tetratricopeptide (TPR) repeat protein n=1 Tax=Alkaliphilus hydrothermalis TaxID=1482730 RepID=A0ABS2NNS6_9FIRM|nr:stalk domain-containing protein [Alkaliphilus hydrothermalis]MBM7614477.1 tetratricopeptide (TPR) repeat protein [Alkaliphilus hydrothermalis]